MEALLKKHVSAQSHMRRADTFFFIALGAITFEPSLIMFTAKLTNVGILAVVLWLGFPVLLLVN
jgi:hypothetical protein